MYESGPPRREAFRADAAPYARLTTFAADARAGVLFEDFAMRSRVHAEVHAFWFLDYTRTCLPTTGLGGVKTWREAGLALRGRRGDARAIVKIYCDYDKVAGNGALLHGRQIELRVEAGRAGAPGRRAINTAREARELGMV